MTSKTCHACGREYSEIARMYSEFVRCHGANELWLQLIDAAAGVLAARERLAETLSCTDEEYVAVLARLEIMLAMAIRGVERDGPIRPGQDDAWLHPGLAIALLIVEASKWARHVTDILSVWRAAINARQALDRLILPWEGLMAEARRSVAVEFRLCRTCQVQEGHREV